MSILHFYLERCQTCIPAWVSAYSSVHMDSIPKLINHLLVAMFLCNFFLFIACFQAAMAPDIGLDSLLISFLLCFQNVITWLVLNNGRLPHTFNALAPSDFLLGVTLGIAVGGSILSFVLSLFFGRMSRCKPTSEGGSYYTDFCDHRGTMVAIWFWSGIVFWLNTAIALLIALGRDELSYFAQSNYESIGISLDEFENSFERYNSHLQHNQQDNGDFVQVGEATVTPESKRQSADR